MGTAIGVGVGISKFQAVPGGGGAPAWTPADLPDLELWLANSFLASVGDGNPIAQWNDASGNANHVVQATAANRPTAQLVGGVWQATFDGVDDELVKSSVGPFAQPHTWAFVAQQNPVGTSPARVYVNFGGGSIYTAASKYQVFAGSGGDTGVVANTSRHYIVVILNGASTKFRVDGVEIATINPGTGGASAARIGSDGSNPMQGNIREVVFCSSALAGDDLTNLESYLGGLV